MSSAAPSAKAAAAAKAKKEKQILAISAIVLLALLGFELPKLMKGSDTASAPLTPQVTAPIAGATDAAAPLAVATSTLPDTDRVTVQAGSGQLIAFGLFKSKDPFVQQLSTNPDAPASPAAAGPSTGPVTEPVGIPATSPASPASPSATPATTSAQVPPPFGTTTPAQPGTTPLTGGSTPPASTTPASATPSATPSSQSSTAPVVAPTAVAISTNGQCENVSLNGTFPGNEDIFKLVSIAKNGKSAKIAIVGGAYDDGQATTAIQQGVKTTLVNTADGTRYVIELVSKCAGQPSPSAASSGTSTGPSGSASSGTVSAGTVAAPTVPTSTSTTPIVTDLLDALSPVGK